MKRPGWLYKFDHLSYVEAWEFQRRLVEERGENRCPDTLVLLEHEPVFTFGRRTKADHWGGDEEALRRLGYGVYPIERGGSVTYHGPGQLVGYPILRLRDFCAGPKPYVGKLEDVLIRVLKEWGITGRRVDKWRGVWVGDSEPPLQKIAAVGVRITRGVTMHGFALNVDVDVKPFDLITPCGIEGCQVTSMAKALGIQLNRGEVRERVAHHFGEVFRLEWEEKEGECSSGVG